MLTPEEIEQNLLFGYERREFEVKGPGLLKMPFASKVVRAALAMGNLQDGGHILIGVDDEALQEMAPGLTEEEVQSWTNHDELSDLLRKYADPPLNFEVKDVVLPNGNRVVVIQVFEFADLPHLCAKTYGSSDKKEQLREGALYVRPRGKPSSVPVSSSIEMREVLDLASAKRLRDFVAMTDRAGVQIAAPESAEDSYRRDVERAWPE